MKKLSRIGRSIFLLFFYALTFGQDCGIDGHHKNCMATDPVYKEGYLKNQDHMEQMRQNPQFASRRAQNGPYVLPIVIHIIHLGENHSSNMDEQIVLNAVQRLNDDFNGSLYAGNIDAEIQFCLASIDPDGNPTNGINRVDGSHIQEYRDFGVRWSDNIGVDGSVAKDLSRWPTSQYMNVWVVHRINGAGAFAEFPNGGLYDGIMMQPHNLNSEIFAHEIGHNLDLFHTFNGNDNACIENEDCTTQGDRVCDTPAHKVDDCFNTDCSNTNYFENASNNFMSYCSQRRLFTEGQKQRMITTINGPIRRTLLSSVGCASSLPSNNISLLEIFNGDLPFCNGLVSPIINVRNNGSRSINSFEVRYRVNNGPYSSQVVNSNLNFGESSLFTLEGIEMAMGENMLEVEVLNPNGVQDEFPEYDRLEIEIENNKENLIVSPEYFEDFESFYNLEYDLLPPGYSTYGEDREYSSWNHVRNGINVWLSAASFSFSGEVEVDVLEMPLVDLSDTDNAELLFKYSFTRRDEFDPNGYGLKVVAYRGCNGSAEVLWERYDHELQSAPLGPPNAEESYKTVSIDLGAYKDELLKIEFHYSFSNQAFYYINLDNILIQGDRNGNVGSCQIPISPEMIFNPDGSLANPNTGGASLFDEQLNAGEPGYDLGGIVEIPWTTPYAPNQSVYVDLGAEYNISDIHYYDTFGQGIFKIKPTLPNVPYIGEYALTLSAWPTRWDNISNLNWQTRYITFTKEEVGAHIGEIYICGTPVDGTQPTCQDGIQNQNETGIDCGGVCPDCETEGTDCEENIAGFSYYGTFENHNYYLSNNIATWNQAEEICQQNGGHLVTINSAAENNFIQQNIEATFILIGANDAASEGNINWSSGEPFGFNNLGSNNTAGNDYGMMNFWDGSWTLIAENIAKYYMLEIPCNDNQGEGISLNCPDNIEILLPFQTTLGQVIYDVNAITDCTSGDVTIDINGIPSGETTLFGRYPIEVTATDPCGNSKSCSFFVDLITRQHFSSADCPEDIVVTASDQNGAIVTWDEPTTTTDCEGLTLFRQGFYSSGDLIPIGTHQIDYAWREEGPESICGGFASCNFQVTVLAPEQGGDCPDEIAGYTSLGEFGTSKYYISDTKKNWQDAQLEVLINTDGYLASISSEAENEFIRSNIGNEIVIIGLSDRRNEGTLVWDSGEPYAFSKLEVNNTHAVDNGYMNFWNGGWGLDGPWTSRYYILEVPCSGESGEGIDLTCPNDIEIVLEIDEFSRPVNYEVQLSTDCEQGGLTYNVSGGPLSGERFFQGYYDMSIEATDNCNNVETCDFAINIEYADYQTTVTCPEDITIVSTDNVGAIVTWDEPLLESDCDLFLASVYPYESGDYLPIGTHIITYNYLETGFTAVCNSSSLCTFEVTVEGSDNTLKPDMTLSNFTYSEFSVENGEVLFFNVDVSNIGNTISGAFSLKSYISTDRILSADDIQDGEINSNNFSAGQTVRAVTGALTVPEDLAEGQYYIILEVDANDQLNELNENNNILAAISQFEVRSVQTDCSDTYPNATYIGERGDSKYFISNDTYTWENGKAYIQSTTRGNLASINTSGENLFLYERIGNNVVFIGLNDAGSEGTFVWDSGDQFILNNLTNENSPSNDYAHMKFWDGSWGMDGRWTKRKVLIEVDCSSTAGSSFEDIQLRDSERILTKEKLKITQLFPNPASESIHVEIQSLESEKVQMKLYNMEGQLIRSESINISDKVQIIPLDISKFDAGIYQILILDEDGNSYSERFVKAQK